MVAPLFDAADLAELSTLKEAALLVRAVGGLTWNISRPTGDGMTAPTGGAAAGSLTGEVTQGGETRLATTAPGGTIGDAPWVLTYTGGTLPQPDDTITSAANAAIRFTVLAPAADYLHPTWLLERLP
jgi:hypothetical protein